MPRSIIVGSGPAAAGVALALTERPDQEVVVVDLGNTLEPAHAATRSRLGARRPAEWSPSDLAEISSRAAITKGTPLPQKRTFGSAFPFADVGQLDGVSSLGGANREVISGAYGGFSNVWGSQIMPFSAITFDDWPFSLAELEPHYRRVLDEVPLAAEEDDLSVLFPLIHRTSRLPPSAERTEMVLRRFASHRDRLERYGVIVGHARLAFRARECVRCGLCMTGCPYHLIYSASHTFDRLRRQGRIRYVGGVLVHRVAQDGEVCAVRGTDQRSREPVELTGDRMYLACGGIGTTRLVLASMARPPTRLKMFESLQFGIPFLSQRPTTDPRLDETYTLNQFNIVVDVTGTGRDLVQVHCYPYNPAVSDSMPWWLRSAPLKTAHREIVRRTTVGLGYLPSWASPRITILQTPRGRDQLPSITVTGESSNPQPPMLAAALRRLRRAGPRLDLWPMTSASFVSGAAKSYHFGGSFPHATGGGVNTVDRLGRLPEWSRIHLSDGSVFPSVPATTFTLTVMANAHRIAAASLHV